VQTVFNSRGLAITPCLDADLADATFLSSQVAVIFLQHAEAPSALKSVLRKNAASLLNHDCQIIVRVVTAYTGNGGVQNLASRFAEVIAEPHLPAAGYAVFPDSTQRYHRFDPRILEYFPHLRFFSEFADWNEIANHVASISPGKGPNGQLEITSSPEVVLDEEQRILLARAFADCSHIHLVSMADEGRSGGTVLRAYADLQQGLHGRWPQPFFVKIGIRKKIVAEFQNYHQAVDPYIPFHLGPHLVDHRCHLGARLGVLVGDFVERSESLGACAVHGRATQAIGNLFSNTLEGWYRIAVEKQTPLSSTLKIPARNWDDGRLARAWELGATRSPNVLDGLFRRSDSAGSVLTGPAHGDLHAANILVRANDAIVIDFYAHRNLPLVYDAACLEASLVVDGFARDSRDIDTWLKSILPLYSKPLFEFSPVVAHPKDQSAWFYSTVGQIRVHARHLERGRGQYAAALAVALLNKAHKDATASEPEGSRRAAAYVLAETILAVTFDREIGSEPSAA
jgi:hypothetical protein